MPRQRAVPVVVHLVGFVVLFVSARAHAQSVVTDAVYQDVKTVIEDLLTREVSQTVATHMACLAGYRESSKDAPNAIDITTNLSDGGAPGAKDIYVSLEAMTAFPNTLQAIYNERYSSLKPVLLAEMSSFVADMAYHLLRAQAGSPRVQAAVAAGDRTAQLPAKTPAAQTTFRQDGTSVSDETLVELMRVRASLISKQGKAARKNIEAQKTAAAPGAPVETPKIAFQPLHEDSELETCAANLGFLISTKQITAQGGPLDKDCDVSEPSRDEYACDVAYAIQHSLVDEATTAQTFLVRALTVYVDELMTVSAPTQAEIAATVTIVSSMLFTSDRTETAVKDGVDALNAALKLKEAVDLATVRLPLTELVDQWKAYRLSDGVAIPVTRLADIAGGISTLIEEDCNENRAAKACSFFKKEKEVLGVGAELWPIVRLAARGDYVDSAQLAVGILFNGARQSCADMTAARTQASIVDVLWDGPPRAPDACELVPYLQTFTDDVIVYAVQDLVSGTPSDEARSTLRAATEDLVQQLSLNGGIDRAAFGWKANFLPDLALRYEWSPSFAIDGPGSGRFVASVPFLKVRKRFAYSRMIYSAFEVSLADLVAPLAELALRSGGITPAHESRIWANVLSPRVDIEGGIPALSKHLLVGGGITYRFVTPAIVTPATVTTAAAYEYQWPKRQNWEDGFQFGVFAKYTM